MNKTIWVCPVCHRVELSEPLSDTHFFGDTLEHCVQPESKWIENIPLSSYQELLSLVDKARPMIESLIGFLESDQDQDEQEWLDSYKKIMGGE